MKIELLEMVIKHVKSLATPKDAPMLFCKEKNKLVLACLALEKKQQICLAIHALKEKTQCEEMVFVSQAWAANALKDNTSMSKLSPSKRPDRRECFVLNYFSKDLCLLHILEFTRDKNNNIIWGKEIKYKNAGKCESIFNPFKFTDVQLKKWIIEIECDEIKKKGTKKVTDLPNDFKLVVYRLKNKAFFEVFNEKGEAFFGIQPVKYDTDFQETLDTLPILLNYVAEGDLDKAAELISKIKDKNKW